jgi:hypothetical protein
VSRRVGRTRRRVAYVSFAFVPNVQSEDQRASRVRTKKKSNMRRLTRRRISSRRVSNTRGHGARVASRNTGRWIAGRRVSRWGGASWRVSSRGVSYECKRKKQGDTSATCHSIMADRSHPIHSQSDSAPHPFPLRPPWLVWLLYLAEEELRPAESSGWSWCCGLFARGT